jgi:4-hydroxy-tetrahydrodipicolinate reductase
MRARVAIIGANGRMGRFASDLLAQSSEFELVARIEKEHDLAAVVTETRAAVALDVTHAGLGFEHGRVLLEKGVRPLIGTSGVTVEETAALDALARARGLGGLVVPNFSLGMCLMQRAALDAARAFARCEIIEMHHDKKRDAPSGTALDTAERLRAAEGSLVRDVPIHSVRLPGLYAHQLVVFGAVGESYTLRHDMSGPEGFADGIRIALRYVATARGVARGLSVALEARGG